MSKRPLQLGPRSICLVAFGAAALLSIGVAACGGGDDKVTVGLITKRDSNPFFVKIKDIAKKTAGDDHEIGRAHV